MKNVLKAVFAAGTLAMSLLWLAAPAAAHGNNVSAYLGADGFGVQIGGGYGGYGYGPYYRAPHYRAHGGYDYPSHSNRGQGPYSGHRYGPYGYGYGSSPSYGSSYYGYGYSQGHHPHH